MDDALLKEARVTPITPVSPPEVVTKTVRRIIPAFKPTLSRSMQPDRLAKPRKEDLLMRARVERALENLARMHETDEINEPNPNFISPPDNS